MNDWGARNGPTEPLNGSQDLLGTVHGITLVAEASSQFAIELPELVFEPADLVFQRLCDRDGVRKQLGGVHVSSFLVVSGKANGLSWHDRSLLRFETRPLQNHDRGNRESRLLNFSDALII